MPERVTHDDGHEPVGFRSLLATPPWRAPAHWRSWVTALYVLAIVSDVAAVVVCIAYLIDR